MNRFIEINGTHLVADAIAGADAQCERALTLPLLSFEYFWTSSFLTNFV